MERNLLLKIGYCGTNYCGWQTQDGFPTVQQTVEEALAELTRVKKVTVYGCSRTDSGVHARQFVLNFRTDCPIPCDRLPIALTALLPEDIACFYAQPVREDFHARYDCAGKEYAYYIRNTMMRDPLWYKRAYHYPYPLDIERMQQAAAQLGGKRDYAAFAAAGSQVKSTVRTIHHIKVEQQGELLVIRVAGDGFLYNMVRIIVGTLLLIGRGSLTVEEVLDALAKGDRTRVGPTVPPWGLYLNEVYYRPEEQIGG